MLNGDGMTGTTEYRNQFILVYHMAFNSIECRLSFLDGNRMHREYLQHIFPFILNMLKDADLRVVAEPAMIHMVDVIAEYARKLRVLYSKDRTKQLLLERIAKNKLGIKGGESPRSVLNYALRVAEVDGLRHGSRLDDFELDREFPYWPEDLADKLGLLDAAYADYNAVMQEFQKICDDYPGDRKDIKRPAVATSIQLMTGPRDFISHIGTAFQYGLRLRVADNDPVLAKKSIRSAVGHLHRLLFDFLKVSMLMAFHADKYLRSPRMTPTRVKALLKARHNEHCMMGRDFLERYQMLHDAMASIVSSVMPDVRLQQIALEEAS